MPEMGAATVRLGEDRDRLDSLFVTGADDPKGYLTAVGDEDALQFHLTPDPSPCRRGERS
jgi:hypothetical protein